MTGGWGRWDAMAAKHFESKTMKNSERPEKRLGGHSTMLYITANMGLGASVITLAQEWGATHT